MTQHLLLTGNSLIVFLNVLVSCALLEDAGLLPVMINCNLMTILLTFILIRMWQSAQVIYAGFNSWIVVSDMLK